jgi:hypothetical protein
MITRLFAAFASLKQKVVFKFDSIKVSKCKQFCISLFFLLGKDFCSDARSEDMEISAKMLSKKQGKLQAHVVLAVFHHIFAHHPFHVIKQITT